MVLYHNEIKLYPSKMRGKRSLSLIVHKLSTEGLNVSTVPIDAVLVHFRYLTKIWEIYTWLLEIQPFKIHNIFISLCTQINPLTGLFHVLDIYTKMRPEVILAYGDAV